KLRRQPKRVGCLIQWSRLKICLQFERAQKTPDRNFSVLLRLTEDPHTERRAPHIVDGLKARLMFQVGVIRHPWSPPCDAPIPHFSFLFIEGGIEQFRTR